MSGRRYSIDDILHPGERELREVARLKRQQAFLEGEMELFRRADAGDRDAQALVRQRGYTGPFRSDERPSLSPDVVEALLEAGREPLS